MESEAEKVSSMTFVQNLTFLVISQKPSWKYDIYKNESKKYIFGISLVTLFSTPNSSYYGINVHIVALVEFEIL